MASATSHLCCVPCVPAHVLLMTDYGETGRAMPLEMLDRAMAICEHEDASVPLCCFGITTMWQGVGSAWFLERTQERTQQQTLAIARYVWEWWHIWIRDFRYVEALARADREDSRRLLAWLGCEIACIKQGYGPLGETMVEYCWRAA